MPGQSRRRYLQKELLVTKGQQDVHHNPRDWIADTRRHLRHSATRILPRIIQCALGEVEMTAAQLKAATLLLGKVLPDLHETEVNINDNRPITAWTTAELLYYIDSRGSKERIGATIEGVAEPAGVH